MAQVGTERLGRRQEYTTIAYGVALNKVEVAVRVELIVIIQTIATQHFQERCVFHTLIGDIGEIHTCSIALELDIQTELGFLDLRSQIIHVFHHQFPVGLRRIIRGVLQRLHKECLGGLGNICGKLAHLIGHTTQSKLVSHGQHLIGLESALQ